MEDKSDRLPISLGAEPLVEAVWEMRFEPAHQAAAAVLFAKLLAELGSKDSKPEQLPVSQLPAQIREMDPNLRFAGTMRFRDSKNLVYQCGERAIAVSSPKPYVRWASFRKAIEDVCFLARSTNAIQWPNRMSLKYVDILELNPKPALSLLKVKVSLASVVLDDEPFFMRSEIVRDGHLHIIQIGLPATASPPGGVPTAPGLLIDIDSIVEAPAEINTFWDSVTSVLDHVHSANKRIFFSLLSDETLAALKPEYAK